MKSPDGRECGEHVTHKILAFSGRRSATLYLDNPNERKVERVIVDGCAITEGPRCDWLVLVDDPHSKEEIYVELKGCDLHHGITQLEESINRLSADRCALPKRCILVFSRNPMTGTDEQRYKAQFRRKFNAKLSMARSNSRLTL